MGRLISVAAALAALFFLAVLAMCAFLASAALAHDIYSNVYEYNAPKDQGRKLCCGGGEKGDCEGLGYEDMAETPDGIVIISKRYKARVFIPRHRIQWDVPRDGYSGEAADPKSTHPIHWCGKPRSAAPGWGVDRDNPDPDFITFCAFIAPGGV